MPTDQEIQEAVERCRARFAAVPDATHGAHIHHAPAYGQYVERLMEPIEARIQYILLHKKREEWVIRLDAMRPATVAEVALDAEWRQKWDALDAEYRQKLDAFNAEWDALNAEWRQKWDALHKTECTPDCPWDGTTILPGVA